MITLRDSDSPRSTAPVICGKYLLRIKERRKEVTTAVAQTRRVLEQMEAALKADDAALLKEFRGVHLYSERNYDKPKESTVDRALRILALCGEEEITLAEATRLVGDALKL